MDKKQITKLCISGAAAILATAYACGLFTGGSLNYDVPKLDRRVKDGIYSAQKTNNFSTVRVDMTIENRAITDCEITSFGDGDLMTDEIRSSWAQAIVEAQSGAPDAITGATLVFSAGSVQEAVEDIMAQAVGDKEPDPIEEPPAASPAAAPAQTEVAAPAQPAAQPENAAPAETKTVEAPSSDPTRLMRPRPALGAAAPTAVEEPDPAAEAPSSDPARLMRVRPVITAGEPAEAEKSADAKETAPAAEAPSSDPSRLMRVRPVITTGEPAEAEKSADMKETAPAAEAPR